MTVLTPHLALFAALTTVAGAAMIRLGLSRGLLQLRRAATVPRVRSADPRLRLPEVCRL